MAMDLPTTHLPNYTALLQALPSPILPQGVINISPPAEGATTTIKQRRSRTRFDDAGTALLAATFAQTAYPDYRRRKELAEILGVTEARIAVWFQNRRTRVRKSNNLEPGTPGPHSRKSRNVFVLLADSDNSTFDHDTSLHTSPDHIHSDESPLRADPMDLSASGESTYSAPTTAALDLRCSGSSQKRSLTDSDDDQPQVKMPRFDSAAVFPKPEPAESPVSEGDAAAAVWTSSDGAIAVYPSTEDAECNVDSAVSSSNAEDHDHFKSSEVTDCSVSTSSDSERATSPETESPITESQTEATSTRATTESPTTVASTSIDSGRGSATSSPRDYTSPPSIADEPLDLSAPRGYSNSVKMPLFPASVFPPNFAATPFPVAAAYPSMLPMPSAAFGGAPLPMFPRPHDTSPLAGSAPLPMFPRSHDTSPMAIPMINQMAHYGAYLQALRHIQQAAMPPRGGFSPVVYPDLLR